MQTKPLYAILASTLQALRNCEFKADNAIMDYPHWRDMCTMHTERIEALCRKYLPHGSGFDSGCKLDIAASKPNRLIFSADFHHMDDNGYYCGWSTHSVIVTPCLAHGYALRITGRDKRQIKDYIADTFHHVLRIEVTQ